MMRDASNPDPRDSRLRRPAWLSLRRLGVAPVLLAVCAGLSVATIAEQPTTGKAGGAALAADVLRTMPNDARIAVVASANSEDREFVEAFRQGLAGTDRQIVAATLGEPADARAALDRLQAAGTRLDALAATEAASRWPALTASLARNPVWSDVKVLFPRSSRGSTFLAPANLLNILQQISVIAILAIGMTMVIVAGGIDLSVGSLMALSAVTATLLMSEWAGGVEASVALTALCCVAALILCAAVGLANGLLVTRFQLPPFIVTLSVLLIARGSARILSDEQSISRIPAHFAAIGAGADGFGIPNAVLLMAVLYVLAHLLMTRTALGRAIYAVGGNAEAARLSGVAVGKVTCFVYTLSALLAGLGGLLLASRLRSGDPKFGDQYELDVIAAVVVGGASLRGGEGRIVGTLLGALLIAVIRNGMNLLGVRSSMQMIMLGCVIVGAVLADRSKTRRP